MVPAAPDRPALVAPGSAAWAAGLGLGLGLVAAWKAPEHHGAVVWAASLAVLAVGGSVVAERRSGPRAAAAFGGALLAMSPVVALVAHSTLTERLTSEPHRLACGLGETMLTFIGVPMAVAVVGAVSLLCGVLASTERRLVARWRDRLAPAAATMGLVACAAFGAWTWLRGVPVPSRDEYLASIPPRGTADALHLAPAEQPSDGVTPKRIHRVDAAGVDLHRSCEPPQPVRPGGGMYQPASCWIGVAHGPDPEQPWDAHWAGPIDAHSPLEVRFDEKNRAWIVVAQLDAFAFQQDTAMPVVLQLRDAMAGPPRHWAWSALVGAAAALRALFMRRRRRSALADIDAAVEGTVTSAGWIALEDGRTLRAPDGLADGERVLVMTKATAAAAYRDADVAIGVIRGDRAALVAGVRSAMSAHAIVAFTAAVLAMAPLLVSLLG